jgi:MFS family permease
MSILLYRNFFYHGAKASTAEAHYGYLAAAGAVGYFLAALLTPPVTRRLTKAAVIALALAASAVLIGVIGQTFDQIAYLFMAFCLGLAGQATAICTTTILQEELPDEYRGRAFSYYDMMFNITFAAGMLICLPFMPTNGRSVGLMAFVAIGYAVTAGGYWLFARQSAGPRPLVSGPAGPAGGASSPADAAQASNS